MIILYFDIEILENMEVIKIFTNCIILVHITFCEHLDDPLFEIIHLINISSNSSRVESMHVFFYNHE